MSQEKIFSIIHHKKIVLPTFQSFQSSNKTFFGLKFFLKHKFFFCQKNQNEKLFNFGVEKLNQKRNFIFFIKIFREYDILKECLLSNSQLICFDYLEKEELKYKKIEKYEEKYKKLIEFLTINKNTNNTINQKLLSFINQQILVV